MSWILSFCSSLRVVKSLQGLNRRTVLGFSAGVAGALDLSSARAQSATHAAVTTIDAIRDLRRNMTGSFPFVRYGGMPRAFPARDDSKSAAADPNKPSFADRAVGPIS